jgi:hypothetical protein
MGGLVLCLCSLGSAATIDVSTGAAGWTVGGLAAIDVVPDPVWVAPPTGTSWVTAQGGVGLPNFYHSPGTFVYSLPIPALTPGFAGTLSYSVSADNNYQVAFTDINCSGIGCNASNI